MSNEPQKLRQRYYAKKGALSHSKSHAMMKEQKDITNKVSLLTIRPEEISKPQQKALQKTKKILREAKENSARPLDKSEYSETQILKHSKSALTKKVTLSKDTMHNLIL